VASQFVLLQDITPAPNSYALTIMYVPPQAGAIQVTDCRYGITKLITAFTEN
jgi:hypothetical protein